MIDRMFGIGTPIADPRVFGAGDPPADPWDAVWPEDSGYQQDKDSGDHF